MLFLSINLLNYPNIYISILFLLLQFSMIVSIYLLYTVLEFIRTVFLHVLNMLFGLMTTRLNKCYYYFVNKKSATHASIILCKTLGVHVNMTSLKPTAKHKYGGLVRLTSADCCEPSDCVRVYAIQGHRCLF